MLKALQGTRGLCGGDIVGSDLGASENRGTLSGGPFTGGTPILILGNSHLGAGLGAPTRP